MLLDIAMPVMDGMQALPLIREAAPEATVVMLSGYPFSTAGPGALDAGAHGYLEKSDLVHGLIPRLERIIEGSSDGAPDAGRGYSPRNCAVRFSRAAAMPSWRSAVARVIGWASASHCTPDSRSRWPPSRRASLV